MKKMTSNEIRDTWLNFFKKNGHQIIDSASIIPKDDNSLLWINSGVAVLKKFFSGIETPLSNKLTNSQKCLRTNDMHNVGTTSRHHTLFEMLGNFSIGNYFKLEAINFAYDLLIKEFEMDINKIFITVFEDDPDSYEKWLSLGIKKDQIIKCGRDRNFWDLGSGPCGPCTEIYYDRGEKFDPNKTGVKLFIDDIENDRYIEIWNIVFSEYNNDGKNNYTKLARKNIDTGAGLERLACISQDTATNFETDLFMETINIIQKYSDFKYNPNTKNTGDENDKTSWFRVIVDHLRASIFAIADGVNPSNKDRGYILKKIIRRILIAFNLLKIEKDILQEIIESQIDILKHQYSYLLNSIDKIKYIFKKERISFIKTIKDSSVMFKEWINVGKINSKDLFNLVDTYGFPMEFIESLENKQFKNIEIILNLSEKESKKLQLININFADVKNYFAKHRDISKKDSKEIGMKTQNDSLINLKVKSLFLYDEMVQLTNVIFVFDEQFKEVSKTETGIFYLVLEKTPFYATSGGQICDKGKINGYEVLDVFKGPNGQHIHKLKLDGKTEINLGNLVNCQINTIHRFKTTAAHSAEHLLHTALKSIVDKDIKQEGAFKSEEKLTFDFYYNERLSLEVLSNIESFINSIITSSIPTEVLFMSLEEAINIGAVAIFEDKYKKIEGKLRVIRIGNISTELCGGTHVLNTKEIERFIITKLEPKGSGTWRIEAIVTNQKCFQYSEKVLEEGTSEMQHYVSELKNKNIRSQEFQDQLLVISKILKSKTNVLREFIEALKVSKTIFQKAILSSESNKVNEESKIIKDLFKSEKEYQEHIITKNFNTKSIHLAMSELVNENPLKAFIVFNISDYDIKYFAIQNIKTKTFDCNSLIQAFNKISNGKGGGKFNFSQGGTSNLECIQKLVNVIEERNLN